MSMNWLPSVLRNWGATSSELTAEMPGDRVVPDSNYTATVALTIDVPPDRVWPWLVQIGYRRGGLYSYDWLDRVFGFLDRPSADQILPEFQHLKVGDTIPIGRAAQWPVVAVEPFHFLVMGGQENGVEWGWAFALHALTENRTRLISRSRVRMPDTCGSRLFMLFLEPAAFLMTRRMLLGIRRRAEAVLGTGIDGRRERRERYVRSVHATHVEQTEPLPADEVIRRPLGSLTHAITIRREKQDVWPWLLQMGAGRAGWYSYDLLDNGCQPSSKQILAQFQKPTIGTIFPALPGATDGFLLMKAETNEWLVLGFPGPQGQPLVTWVFVLRDEGSNWTRLVVRARGSASYRFHGLPSSVSLPLARFVHFVMQRKQLIGIAERVERSGAAERSPNGPELEYANIAVSA